eukprot:3415515-Pleurochrysis_carterae.AAC.1
MADEASTRRRRRQQPSLADHQQRLYQQADRAFEGGVPPSQEEGQLHAFAQEQDEVINSQQDNMCGREAGLDFQQWLCSLTFVDWQFHCWTHHRLLPAAAASTFSVITLLCLPRNEWTPIYISSFAALGLIACFVAFAKLAKLEWRKPGTWILVACYVLARVAKEHLFSSPRSYISPAMLAMEYAMDILRPVMFTASVPIMSMPPSFYIPILV